MFGSPDCGLSQRQCNELDKTIEATADGTLLFDGRLTAALERGLALTPTMMHIVSSPARRRARIELDREANAFVAHLYDRDLAGPIGASGAIANMVHCDVLANGTLRSIEVILPHVIRSTHAEDVASHEDELQFDLVFDSPPDVCDRDALYSYNKGLRFIRIALVRQEEGPVQKSKPYWLADNAFVAVSNSAIVQIGIIGVDLDYLLP